MSAANEGEIIVRLIGGALYVTWHAARLATLAGAGAAVLGYRATRAAIRGTATIVEDANRGRRMRQAAAQGDAAAKRAWEAAQRQAAGRRADHDRRMAGLSHATRAALTAGSAGRDELSRISGRFEEERRRHQAVIEQRCDAFTADLKHAEQRFESDLRQLSATIDEKFQAERLERARELAAERNRVDRALEQQRRDLQGQIDEFHQQAENDAAAADEWIRAAEAAVLAIAANPRHDMFCPGQLPVLESRLALARGNQGQGMAQAAVATAQETVIQGQVTRERLELLTARWEAARALAIQSLEAGIGGLGAAREFRLSDMEVSDGAGSHTEPARDVDTDYWTNGALSSRETKLREALEQISREDATADFDQLEAFRNSGEAALSEAVALQVNAKYALMASLLRAELQAKFAERLADAGYEVVDNAWAGNDERSDNHLVLRGVNHDEISIVLAPKPGESAFSNRVTVLFRDSDHEPNELERAERIQAVTQILREVYDLPPDASLLDCAPGTETLANAPAEAFDLDRVRAAYPGTSALQRKGG